MLIDRNVHRLHNPRNHLRRKGPVLGFVTMIFMAHTLLPVTANAHPHVFVDGGVDFVIGQQNQLEALQVTWLIDEFETLYLLSDHGFSLNSKGGLDESVRKEFIRSLSDWPDHFEGASHLSVDGTDIALNLPINLDAQILNGRLLLTFSRKLALPQTVEKQEVEVGFYDSTYYYAFFVKNEPKIVGDNQNCITNVLPFNPDTQEKVLLGALSKLGREETTGIADIGALFADRIQLRCE